MTDNAELKPCRELKAAEARLIRARRLSRDSEITQCLDDAISYIRRVMARPTPQTPGDADSLDVGIVVLDILDIGVELAHMRIDTKEALRKGATTLKAALPTLAAPDERTPWTPLQAVRERGFKHYWLWFDGRTKLYDDESMDLAKPEVWQYMLTLPAIGISIPEAPPAIAGGGNG